MRSSRGGICWVSGCASVMGEGLGSQCDVGDRRENEKVTPGAVDLQHRNH